MSLDIMQKWNAIQTPLATGIVNGLPAFDNVYCAWGEDGEIHVFKTEKLDRWQAPTEITDAIAPAKLAKMKALALNREDLLPQADRDAIAAAELVASQKEDMAGKLRELRNDFLYIVMRQYYNNPPQWLTDSGWLDRVLAVFPDGLPANRTEIPETLSALVLEAEIKKL